MFEYFRAFDDWKVSASNSDAKLIGCLSVCTKESYELFWGKVFTQDKSTLEKGGGGSAECDTF